MLANFRFLVLVGLIFLAKPALAQQDGLVFSPSFMSFNFDEKENGSSFAKVSAAYIDGQIGYIKQSIYFGGIYSHMSREDGTTNRERTSYGPSLGVVYHQFFLIGHYLMSSTYETAPNTKLTDGSGIQLDIGYWFNVVSSFYAGPKVVYRSIDYKKRDGSPANSASTIETLPYLSLAFIF